jgi:hypothetical protein
MDLLFQRFETLGRITGAAAMTYAAWVGCLAMAVGFASCLQEIGVAPVQLAWVQQLLG